MFIRAIVVSLAIFSFSHPASAVIGGVKVKKMWIDFVKVSPCPSTGKNVLMCPGGWTIDYIVPPCEGGLDDAKNLTWKRYDEARNNGDLTIQKCKARPSNA